MSGSVLNEGRAAFRAQAWPEAFDHLQAAQAESPLEPEDLERLAAVAYLTGRDDVSADAWALAHHGWLRSGEPARAARSAIWLCLTLQLRGDHAQGGAWLARVERLLDDDSLDCVEQGYLLLPAGLQNLAEADPTSAGRPSSPGSCTAP
ncbi:MAG: hypothetical protein H0U22_13850 [Geodermatophilaceae bacterium]|nr:hypothetical protein [Geodermatophilaceae bacterium]